MTTALLNIRLDYDQVLALVRQLSDEDKLRLKDELMAETAKKNNSYIKDLSITEETELISTKEIQDESIIRKEFYEVRPIIVCQEKLNPKVGITGTSGDYSAKVGKTFHIANK